MFLRHTLVTCSVCSLGVPDVPPDEASHVNYIRGTLHEIDAAGWKHIGRHWFCPEHELEYRIEKQRSKTLFIERELQNAYRELKFLEKERDDETK